MKENLFKEIDVEKLNENVFDLISKQWMLITSGDAEKCNTMTASWGGLGYIYEKNVSFVFIRPQRYTFEFVEKNDCYSLCFFEKEYKKILSFCGSNSGKDCEKIKEANLSVDFYENTPYFKEAKLVLICRKIYSDFIKPENFLKTDYVEKFYPNKDYHKMYVGQIERILIKE